MPLIRIDAEATAVAGLASLKGALADLPAGRPVVVMVHGYKYAPGHPGHCPHAGLLGAPPATGGRRAVAWPRRLGAGEGDGALGIAFGWQGRGSLWQAWSEAGRAGVALGRVLDLVAAEGRQADIVAHSLGARVALAALGLARAGSVRNAILIAPAEFRAAATAALDAPAGRMAQVLNVASRENAPFDALVEWLVAPHRPGARALGHGLGRARANWTDLRIDDPDTLAALARLGHRVAPASRRICHWSGYLRPGLFGLYRAILSGALPLPDLRDALPAPGVTPRGRAVEPVTPPLPFASGASL
jgi:hypothetical protein